MPKRSRKSAVASAFRLLGVMVGLWLLWSALLVLLPRCAGAWWPSRDLTRGREGLVDLFIVTVTVAVIVCAICAPVTLTLRRKSLRAVWRGLMYSMTPISLALGGIVAATYNPLPLAIAAALVCYHVVAVGFLSQLPDLVLSGEYPLCAECGYDLRGSPTNRCSECGSGSYAMDEEAKALLDRMVDDGGRVRIEFFDDGRYVLSTRCNGRRHTVSGSDLNTVAGALDEKRRVAHDVAEG